MKQKWIGQEGEIEKSKITVGDINDILSETDRTYRNRLDKNKEEYGTTLSINRT